MCFSELTSREDGDPVILQLFQEDGRPRVPS